MLCLRVVLMAECLSKGVSSKDGCHPHTPVSRHGTQATVLPGPFQAWHWGHFGGFNWWISRTLTELQPGHTGLTRMC